MVIQNRKTAKFRVFTKGVYFEDGYIIYTTSIDNIMPDGILVGKIELKNNNKFEAKPLYDFSQLDFLTVVKFSK